LPSSRFGQFQYYNTPSLVQRLNASEYSLLHCFMCTHFACDKPPSNVLIFGETRVGKSSIINLIMGQNTADRSPSPAAPHSMLKYTPYEVTLKGRHVRLWEVSSISSMGFIRRFRAKWQLKKSYEKLYKLGFDRCLNNWTCLYVPGHRSRRERRL
jgi:hypothetical protein